jgi:hypothetical protein
MNRLLVYSFAPGLLWLRAKKVLGIFILGKGSLSSSAVGIYY